MSAEEALFENQMEESCKTLMTMLDYLGLEAEIRAEQKGQKIGLIVSSEEAGRIIGRKGQALESMQLLVNRIMQKQDENFPRVLIDIDGYSRKPRTRTGKPTGRKGSAGRNNQEDEDRLVKQAQDAAKEVKRWGESVTLPEMNAHDRRLIHITLKDDTEIQTESNGDGPLKSVVISLNK